MVGGGQGGGGGGREAVRRVDVRNLEGLGDRAPRRLQRPTRNDQVTSARRLHRGLELLTYRVTGELPHLLPGGLLFGGPRLCHEEGGFLEVRSDGQAFDAKRFHP